MAEKISGHVEIISPLKSYVMETLQCVHCGNHWIKVPGSGRRRGYCMKCHGVTCGIKECDECIPFEAKLEVSEAIDQERFDLASRLVSRYPNIKVL